MKKFDRDEPNNNLNADNDSILILDIFVAVGNGHIEEARSLIALFGQEEAKKLLNNIRDNTGNTILQMAYKPEMFNYILAQGVNINITNKYGRTLLYDAIEGDDISQIELLLSEGAEINIQDKHGNAPLNFAIVHMKSISTELLLKAGAIANIKNKSDQTPIECLFQTIKYKSLMLSEASNIVRVLLEYGVYDDSADINGNTYLHRFYSNGFASAQLILDLGANVNAENNQGKTALDLLCEEGIERGLETDNATTIAVLFAYGGL